MQYTLPAGFPRWQLATTLPPAQAHEHHLASPGDVTVVIPVKDDPAGLGETLATLASLSPEQRPGMVLVVDDGSSDGGAATRMAMSAVASEGLPAEAIILDANRGPAAARNAGAARVQSSWVWFLDAGVRPASGFLSTLCSAGRDVPAVAWTSRIHAEPTGPIAAYYEAQATLCPPSDGDGLLQAFVTASVVINMQAFAATGGFDVRFRRAACEDLDLGMRLRAHGMIGWLPEVGVYHRFDEDLDDFRRRFRRYGFGFRQFGEKWGVDMEPWPVKSRLPDSFSQHLAQLQFEELTNGWREAQALEAELRQALMAQPSTEMPAA